MKRYLKLDRFDDEVVKCLLKDFIDQNHQLGCVFTIKNHQIFDYSNSTEHKTRVNYYYSLIHYIACEEELKNKADEYYKVLYITKFFDYNLNQLQEFTNMFLDLIND